MAKTLLHYGCFQRMLKSTTMRAVANHNGNPRKSSFVANTATIIPIAIIIGGIIRSPA
jgi:hypothetical protein